MSPEPSALAAKNGMLIFWGIEALVILLLGYILLELGIALFKRVQAGSMSVGKAQLLLGIPATISAFIPVVVMAVFMRFKPLGELVVFDTSNVATVFTMFKMFLAGMAIEAVALGVFWHKVKPYDGKASKNPIKENGGPDI